MNKWLNIAASITALALQPAAHAAYTRATSPPVTIVQIYANEYGSPFIYVSGGVNAACPGNGLYLYDITQMSAPNTTYRNNKMAVLLMAQSTGRQVVLDYYYDPGITGWDACYIEGIQLGD